MNETEQPKPETEQPKVEQSETEQPEVEQSETEQLEELLTRFAPILPLNFVQELRKILELE